MTNPEWLAEVTRRIGISEGSRSTMYVDTTGNPTIGIGFNLNRADARTALEGAGVPPSSVDAVIAGTQSITQPEISALFRYSLAPIESDARASLAVGTYDDLDDARRFVICDLVYNMGAGEEGWGAFTGTQALIDGAQAAKNAGNADHASELFGEAADHLEQSAWYGQVGDRAKRDVAMLRTSQWCDPYGNGSDVL
jgi:GH24 family phage-related lysozyme (muramidase)